MSSGNKNIIAPFAFPLLSLQKLHDLLHSPSFTSDIEEVSSELGTSLVESFNRTATMYAPKDRFFNADGHDLRTKIAVLNHNGARSDRLKDREHGAT